MDYTWQAGPNKKQVKVPATEYTGVCASSYETGGTAECFH